MRLLPLCLLSVCLLLVSTMSWAKNVSELADSTAGYAVATYRQPVIDALAKMVSYKTVAVDGLPLEKNPEFVGYKNYLRQLSGELGLDYQDHGYVLLITLGQGSERLGIVTHGDVQPADPAKWHKSPFELDQDSQPGLLIARGTEDDKGSIATALYAMKAVKDKGIKLDRKIELIIYLAEESDWNPFREFLKTYQPPQINVTIDAEYPVVVAENGWSNISVDIPAIDQPCESACIVEFGGGAFGSQIPEDAKAVIEHASKALLKRLKQQALLYPQVTFAFSLQQDTLTVTARGKSAHSSTPQDGINAIAFLAAVLGHENWPKTTAGLTLAYLNELVGTGLYGEKFGDIAHQHDFMGKMTLAPTVVKSNKDSLSHKSLSHNSSGININLNLRRPLGKTAEQLTAQTEAVLLNWQRKHGVTLENKALYFGEPLLVKDAPHVKPLLGIFSRHTGIANPQPLSVGGSTNAKLLPNAVSFGPSMPGVTYSGHSEHEFISVKQLNLNLAMVTAMLVELGLL